MAKAARYIAEPDERDGPDKGPDIWGPDIWGPDIWSALKRRAEAMAHQSRHPWLLAAIVLAAISFGAGAIAGSLAAPSTPVHPAQQGACAALQMAAAHGYLDERQQRVVMRALTTALNPHADLFPGGYGALRQTCTASIGQ